MIIKSSLVLLGVIVLCSFTSRAGEWTRSLDLMGRQWQGKANLKRVRHAGPDGEDVVEWTIQASRPQELKLTLTAAGIDLRQFDEIACDFMTLGSDCSPQITILEWPRPKTMSNWYAKIRRPLGKWLSWHCDLKLDDDGVFLTPGYVKKSYFPSGPELVFKMCPRFMRTSGEPPWRKMRIANLRLVRHPVRIAFAKEKARYRITAAGFVTSYTIHVTNCMRIAGTAVLIADTRDMKFHRAVFAAAGKPEIVVPLAAGQSKDVILRISIDRRRAEMLPPLYAEPVYLSAGMREVPQVTVRPLMGYRTWVPWAAVPAFNMRHPRPAETMAFFRQMAKLYPSAQQISVQAVTRGRKLLNKTYEVLTLGPTSHEQNYICKKCQIYLQPVDIKHHKCPKCSTIYTDDIICRAYLRRRHGSYMKAVVTLANAYQHSGDEAFARKAREILVQYADKYEHIISQEPRSTASQSKMCSTTLGEAFAMWRVFYAWHQLAASNSFSDADRHHIERDFLLNSASRLMRHGASMNQRAEYFKCFGFAGLYCKCWSLAGEAIYGSQGFFSLLDDGFSADGIALEGGGYHRSTMQSMCYFARLMERQGVNLFTPRLKRIFDGSAAVSPLGISEYGAAYYETAYRMYRDPLYLPTVYSVRKRRRPSMLTITDGVVGLPPSPATLTASSRLDATGYLFLRRQWSSRHCCLAINYGMQWERSEKDRLHFRLFTDGKPVSGQVGRIIYGSVFSHNMYHSFAHNLVTVDRMDMREERVALVAQRDTGELAAALFMTKDATPLYPGGQAIPVGGSSGGSLFYCRLSHVGTAACLRLALLSGRLRTESRASACNGQWRTQNV